MKNTILKMTAWIVLFVTIIISLVVFSLIFFITIWIKNANLTKLVLFDFGLVIVAGLVLVSGIGCFEFMRSLIKVEKEVTAVKEEIKNVEGGKSEARNLSSGTHSETNRHQ